jgi:phasin family protein
MHATPDEFTAATLTNIEVSLALANTVLSSVEKLTVLHLKAARTVFEDGVASSKALLGAKTIDESVELHIAMAQPAFEKVVAYTGSIYEFAAQSREALAGLITAQVANMTKTTKKAVNLTDSNAAIATRPGVAPKVKKAA